MNFLDNVYGVLFNPKYQFQNFFTRDNFSTSFLVILFLSLINSFAFNVSFFALPFTFLFSLFSLSVIWVILSVILNFSSDLLGGEAKVSNTMTAVSYSMLPLMFKYPLTAIFLGTDLTFLKVIINLLLYSWCLVLLVISLNNAQKYQTEKAIISLLSIPFIFMFIFIGFILSGIFSIAMFL